MITFLPLPNFRKSAHCLDNARLNKQIVEVWEIYNILKSPRQNEGWLRHPAVKMWVGKESTLLVYGVWCWNEWIDRCKAGMTQSRDVLHQSGLAIWEELKTNYANCRKPYPIWFGNPDFHSSHRAILLGKNFNWYKQFDWGEKPAEKTNGKWPYVWPTL